MVLKVLAVAELNCRLTLVLRPSAHAVFTPNGQDRGRAKDLHFGGTSLLCKLALLPSAVRKKLLFKHNFIDIERSPIGIHVCIQGEAKAADDV